MKQIYSKPFINLSIVNSLEHISSIEIGKSQIEEGLLGEDED